MRWQDKLTRDELKHLRDIAGVVTKIQAERIFAAQKYMRDKYTRDKGGSEPCWTCKRIAEKLGCPV